MVLRKRQHQFSKFIGTFELATNEYAFRKFFKQWMDKYKIYMTGSHTDGPSGFSVTWFVDRKKGDRVLGDKTIKKITRDLGRAYKRMFGGKLKIKKLDFASMHYGSRLPGYKITIVGKHTGTEEDARNRYMEIFKR